jgi:hypothetical protein
MNRPMLRSRGTTGHDPINEQLGVVDQRLEAWFDAYGWTAPTGYLQGPSGLETDGDPDRDAE